jgi:hypothetical protein
MKKERIQLEGRRRSVVLHLESFPEEGRGDGIRLKPPLEMSWLMTPGIETGVCGSASLIDNAETE